MDSKVIFIGILALLLVGCSGSDSPTPPPSGEPHTADDYLKLGDYYTAVKQYSRAIGYYDQAILLSPNNAEAYNNRGYAHYWNNDARRAIADYDQALELRPDYAYAYNNRCAVYLSIGKQEQAIKDCTQAIKLQPDFSQAYINRANAYLRLGKFSRAYADFHHEGILSPVRVVGCLLVPLGITLLLGYAIRKRRHSSTGYAGQIAERWSVYEDIP